MKKYLFLWINLIVLGAALPAFAIGTSSAKITLYKAYVSTNGDCSSPVAFLDEPNGVEKDFASSDNTIGSGNIAAGTYKCVIFKMSDKVTFVPDASDGSSCVAGTEYTMDVCQPISSQDGTTTTPQTTNADDRTQKVDCTTGNDTMWIYISTFAATTGGSASSNPYGPPTSDGDTTNGFKLSSEVTISADVTGIFVFGTENKVTTQNTGSNGSAACNMDAPDFSFKTS